MQATFKLTITTAKWETIYDEKIGLYRPDYIIVNEEEKQFVHETDVLFNVNEQVNIPELNEKFTIIDRIREVNGDTTYIIHKKIVTGDPYDCQKECEEPNHKIISQRRLGNNKNKANNKSWFSKLLGL